MTGCQNEILQHYSNCIVHLHNQIKSTVSVKFYRNAYTRVLLEKYITPINTATNKPDLIAGENFQGPISSTALNVLGYSEL